MLPGVAQLVVMTALLALCQALSLLHSPITAGRISYPVLAGSSFGLLLLIGESIPSPYSALGAVILLMLGLGWLVATSSLRGDEEG